MTATGRRRAAAAGWAAPAAVRQRPAAARWLALAGAVTAGVIMVVLAHRTAAPNHPGIQPLGLFNRKWALFRTIGLWWLAFAAGAACLLAAPRRAAVVAVLGIAVAVRIAALAPAAPLSDDLYRYAWDGQVQAAGVDPYAYPPTAPELRRLRDPWLWPDAAGCAYDFRKPGCTRINRSTVRTIYPPAAQAFFVAEHLVLPSTAHDRGYEVIGLGIDLAIIGVLLGLLRSWRRDPRWLVLYAWSPLAAVEAVQNAHVDSLGALLALLAVALARKRPAWAAAVIGLATLVKLYPAVLLALVVRRRPVASLAAFTAVVVAGYLPHVLATGGDVLGYLPGFLKENNYANGSGFLLLSFVGLHGPAASAAAVAILGGVGIWVLRDTGAADDVRARRLLGALLLVTTPGAAWYGLPLAAVAALGGAWWWLPVTFAAYPTYFSQTLNGHDHPLVIVSGWLAALAVLVIKGALGARTGDGRGRFHRVARGGRPAGGGPPGAGARRPAPVGASHAAGPRPAG